MPEPLIRFSGVSFNYPHRPPLFSALDFSLQEGDKLGLLGGNGSGKTTLLHLVVGLLKSTGGDVFAFGKKRVTEKDFTSVRAQAGLLFQDPDDMLFCPTVLEDVAFGPMNQGLNQSDAILRAKSILLELGVGSFAPRITHQLSGGEKRMVTLAAVLAMRPKVLLLDEPTNALDQDAKCHLLGVLERLPQSLVLVSHEQDVVDRLANKRVKLDKGTLLYS